MIKYNVEDLIRRAKQLADLENSDFISWNENIMAINEAYQTLYQKAIDKDEKYYLQECLLNAPIVSTNTVCYTLPDDFYQLYAVNDAYSNRCIIKNSVNDPVNTIGYEIVNNELRINGMSNSPVKLRYYPVPKSLTYRGPDAQVGLPPNVLQDVKSSRTMDIYGDFICYITDKLYIYNWKTDTLLENSSLQYDQYQHYLTCGKNLIFLRSRNTSNNNISYSFFTYSGTLLEYPGGFFSGNIYGLDSDKNIIGYNDGVILSYNNNDFVTVSVGPNLKEKLDALKEGVQGESKEEKHYTFTINKDLIYLAEASAIDQGYLIIKAEILSISQDKVLTERLIDDSSSFTYQCFLFGLLLYKNDYLYCVGFGGLAQYTTDFSYINAEEKLIMKFDSNTGYGFATLNSNGFLAQSIYPTTEIDYPNNFYINMLAYQLAIFYKAKQGGDITHLSMLYEQAENQFYDSLTRDSYSFTRVQNVY